ncbi:hypothetical protein BDV25DRAFT_6317 [Aspergillus avenaceus]|uniref:RING-type domain-containing protein n=1 Tax=Aspergillus avenaceus TaxID=36643 RepID=A0A5N6TS38_ASPAV|nr:hypothetical protein BDV25DRAFT_6317 [Aspergillus avenaceus]
MHKSYLATILGLDPQIEHTCIASSSNRRCQKTISLEYRNRARGQLERGSRLFQLDQDVTSVLEQVASLLLCAGAHLQQTGEFVSKWQGILAERNKNRELEASHRRLLMPDGFREEADIDTVKDFYERVLASRKGRTGVERGAGNLKTSSEVGSTRDTKVAEQSGNVKVRPVQPQPVEGECAICLASLLQEVSGPLCSEYSGEEREPGAQYDAERWVWCRQFCGTNYHRTCMERWIEGRKSRQPSTRPTCPTCCAEWVS